MWKIGDVSVYLPLYFISQWLRGCIQICPIPLFDLSEKCQIAHVSVHLTTNFCDGCMGAYKKLQGPEGGGRGDRGKGGAGDTHYASA